MSGFSQTAILTAPWRAPEVVLAAFADEPWAVGLLSGGSGRWSYVARRPARALRVEAGAAGDPFAALSDLLGPPASSDPTGPPFQGGVIGLASYELGDRVEPIGLTRRPGWPDLAAGLYPAVLAFDHDGERVLAIGRGATPDAAEARASDALGWLGLDAPQPAGGALAEPLTPAPPEDYEAAVAEVVRRIGQGEIFQANIARAWGGRLRRGVRPIDILLRLGPACGPFSGYLRLEREAVVSNSPERFVRVEAGGRAETQPIKGTRPRGRDPEEDARLARELVESPKDAAENLMIVDLMRNDLGRVCAPGSVKVPALCRLETFANVHHLVSTVEGELAPGRSAVDLLRAAFPPGSITGAPKVQAMRVIAGLESPRGPYCGSMLWAGFDGALDSNVLIRTALCIEDEAGWSVETWAGAGIVADSDPHAERLETEAKAAGLLRALSDG